MTRDMSLTGVYILTPTCPPVNSVVDLEVMLPAPSGRSKNVLKARMRVLRIEHHRARASPVGFAAAGKVLAVRDGSKGPRVRASKNASVTGKRLVN